MITVFNLGSINMDQIVRLDQFPAPGETIPGTLIGSALGGKGLNVSIALTRAGLAPVHIGAIGRGDSDMQRALAEFGVDTAQIAETDHPSGCAYVFLDQSGENSIVVCPGANNAIAPADVEKALEAAAPGDWLVLQNETSAQKEAAQIARARGMQIAYMAAPFDAGKVAELIGDIDLLALNETEAAQLSAHLGQPITDLGRAGVLVTLGAKGAVFTVGGQEHRVAGRSVSVRDTTAAGDTFFGFFLAELIRTGDPDQSLALANAAAALAVQTEGAAVSIPQLAAVHEMMTG